MDGCLIHTMSCTQTCRYDDGEIMWSMALSFDMATCEVKENDFLIDRGPPRTFGQKL